MVEWSNAWLLNPGDDWDFKNFRIFMALLSPSRSNDNEYLTLVGEKYRRLVVMLAA